MDKKEMVDKLPRFIVGIDLGTTNSAVAYVDTEAHSEGEKEEIQVFPVLQMVAPGTLEKRDTLPSFHYQGTVMERESDAVMNQMEINEAVVGVYARDHGMFMPGRMVSSAKSWLSHAGVDRMAKLLPWHVRREENGEEKTENADVKKLSPVEVSAAYLQHVVRAWNAQFPEEPLVRQDVILTIPASFDEVARELTVRAAKMAGLDRVVLIEEPQAAFYAWISKHTQTWEEEVHPGQKILVCDIGGGTTDFTLIRVRSVHDQEGMVDKSDDFMPDTL